MKVIDKQTFEFKKGVRYITDDLNRIPMSVTYSDYFENVDDYEIGVRRVLVLQLF